MQSPNPLTRRRRPRATRPAPVKALRRQGGHHDELHHAQAFSGIVKALVGLLRVLRVAELSAPPQPASGAPEGAQVLHQSRRKRPRPPTFPMTLGSVHVPRTKPTASETTPAKNAQSTGERHVKYPSTWSAKLLDLHRSLTRPTGVSCPPCLSSLHHSLVTNNVLHSRTNQPCRSMPGFQVSQLASCGTLSNTFQTLPTTWRGQSVAFPRNTGFSAAFGPCGKVARR